MTYILGESSEVHSQKLDISFYCLTYVVRKTAFTPITRVQIPLGTPTQNPRKALSYKHLSAQIALILIENGGFFAWRILGGKNERYL